MSYELVSCIIRLTMWRYMKWGQFIWPLGSDYSLWWGASEIKRCEKQLNTLPLSSQKRVDALTRMSSRIYERRSGERSVLSAARTTHKRTVTLCENNTHVSRTSTYQHTSLSKQGTYISTMNIAWFVRAHYINEIGTEIINPTRHAWFTIKCPFI
jgi:hypothetical protein